jgi:hypothetical protein
VFHPWLIFIGVAHLSIAATAVFGWEKAPRFGLI